MEISIDMLDQSGKLRVTDGKVEDLLNLEKGSNDVNEILYYLGLDWINTNFRYEQDHLHPVFFKFVFFDVVCDFSKNFREIF